MSAGKAGRSELEQRRSRLSAVKRTLLEQRLLRARDPAHGSGVIRERPDRGVAPLSFAQERLWFLDQLEPGNPAYNRPVALRLAGALDVLVLERSLSEIVRRHEVLRATFSHEEGRPVQTVDLGSPATLPVVDLRVLPAAEREAKSRELAREEVQRPFDLAKGPLVRGTLLQLGSEEHVLVLVIHHIAFDGWSAGVLKRELGELYQAFSTGGSSPLPELSIQYADFAHWQREQVQGDALERQLPYWREKLAGCTPLDLPTDRPRPAVLGHRGAHQQEQVSPALVRSLRRLSQEEDVTLYMTLLAAFKVLLHRYTGQDDIVVGSPVAGRAQVATEGLIGFFVNTLVLRTDVSGDPSFRELLGRVRETALGAYDHQDMPLEKLVAELRPERDPSRTPLFQVMFSFENLTDTTLGTQSLSVAEFEFDSGVSQFDLTLELKEQGSGLLCCLGYSTDLFDAPTVVRMLGHYETLLGSIIADPDQRISRFGLLTEGERHLMTSVWNESEADYPEELCLHQLFEAQAERTPDAVAVVFEDQRLTYRELNAHANRLAHTIRSRGVGPDVPVGICVERSLEMVVGVLGILKAGGAYVPLDPGYPNARLDFMLRDTGVGLLLTQERLLSSLPSYSGEVVCLDLDGSPFQEEDTNPRVISDPDNLAYVIYTSGSTGKPKGVLVAHRGAVNYIAFFAEAYDLDETVVVLQLPSMSFDGSVRDIIGSLVVGATSIYVSNAEARIPAELISRIRRHKVNSLLSAVPSMLRAMLDEILEDESDCDSVELVLASGESLLWADRQKAQLALGKAVRMVNQYGPTECTMTSTYYPVPGSASDEGIVPIGRPISNVQVYILDGQLDLVPTGVTGEIHVGGTGLARGYLNRPASTAEAFVPHPFTDEPGARLYRTGDLARFLPDGTIEFVGRRDRQVKIRGFRVELEEIEAVLGQHPGVQGAAVMAFDELPDQGRLVAYVVPSQRPIPSTGELRSFLGERLPGHMLPSPFVILDELPLTSSGKVDHRALRVPGPDRPRLDEPFVPPRTPVEEGLAGIWREVLGLEQVGVHDDFFELGGHSLLATQVISRIQRAFAVGVPLLSLFQSASVAEMAVIIAQAQAERADWEDVERTLAELEAITDEEARHLVAGVKVNQAEL